MRRNPKKGGQFAIIWVDLLYEDSVPATAKILFGEIYRLSGPDGWCDASNQDFMDLLGCSETTVRNLLKALEDVGQIRVESRPRRGGSGGTERYIFCGRKLAPPDAPQVPAENCGHPGGTRRNLRGVPAENCGSTYSKSNSNNIPPKAPQGGRRRKQETKETADWKPERFEEFWKFYRTNVRNEDKQGAIQEWDKLKPDDALLERIYRALKKQIASDLWKRGVGIPYATRYLKNKRWNDVEDQPEESRDVPEKKPKRYVRTDVIDGQEVDIYE